MRPPEAAALLPAAEIGPDWRGVNSVPVSVAARALEERRAYAARHRAAQEAHDHYVKHREHRRRQVASEAFLAAKKRVVKRGTLASTREIDEKAREQAAEAVLRFDLREGPLLGFHDWLNSRAGRAFA